MGEGDGLRKEVFQRGFSCACQAYAEGEARPSQLGLTQPILLHMALSWAQKSLAAALAKIPLTDTKAPLRDPWHASNDPANRLFEVIDSLSRELHILSGARETILQINKYATATPGDSKIDKASTLSDLSRALEHLWAYLQHSLNKIMTFSKQLDVGSTTLRPDDVKRRALLRQAEVDILNAAATVGHDLISSSLTSVQRAEEVYVNVALYLDLLESRILPAHTTVIAEMRAMMLRTRARILRRAV